jgi:TolB-like protein/class 3 adenylate cyclase
MPSLRRLTAIMAADTAGYSRLMGVDEEGTHEMFMAHLRELIEPKIAEHRGRIVKNTGDGFLAEFPSVVNALRCAVDMQRGMTDRNAAIPAERRIEFRVGINLGDVIDEREDLFGDGVNVAARLEGMAEPGGICISEDAYRQVRGKIDVDFIDLGEQTLKNIGQLVRVYRAGSALPPKLPAGSGTGLPLPDKPSIAVLPFANISGDPEQEYFADGMVEEIITALSRIRWLFIIARNSSFTYKGQAVDVKRVGRDLGVRYVLEGSVRKAGGRVRITAQLIEASTNTHLWADRFDGSLEDIFELQDKVALSVAGVIEPALQAAEIRRSTEVPTNNLTAYDLYLRAFPHWQSFDKDRVFLALRLLGQAIERDPHYGPALTLQAHCYCQLCINDWTEDQAATRRAAVDLARRALQSAPEDPEVLAGSAFALGYSGEDINSAISLVERSLVLNPSFARGWFWSGALRILSGEPELALEHFANFLRLSPRERLPFHLTGVGISLFLCRRFEEAVPQLLASLEQAPTFALTFRYLAASYAHLGRLQEAREIIRRLADITPVIVPGNTPLRKPEHRELYLSGLRMAATEEPAL